MVGALRNLFSRERVEITAVDNMSFDVAEGEMVGYIGANGAGKSTTIKMLTGILLPTSGEVRVAGYIPYKERRRYVRNIGVVFGQRTQLWWDLAVIESFRLLQKIYEVPADVFKRRMSELTELLDLSSFLNTPVRKLSLGQRMRCDLTASLLHGPRVLFLDEPTIGLDVLGKSRIRDFLKSIRSKENVTVLLTTHDLEEIEKLCERMIIIDRGKKVFDGKLAELLAFHKAKRKIIVDFEADPQDGKFIGFKERGIDFHRIEEYRWEFSYPAEEMTSAEVIQLIMQQQSLRDIKIEEPGIESVVKDIYLKSGAAAPMGKESAAAEEQPGNA